MNICRRNADIRYSNKTFQRYKKPKAKNFCIAKAPNHGKKYIFCAIFLCKIHFFGAVSDRAKGKKKGKNKNNRFFIFLRFFAFGLLFWGLRNKSINAWPAAQTNRPSITAHTSKPPMNTVAKVIMCRMARLLLSARTLCRYALPCAKDHSRYRSWMFWMARRAASQSCRVWSWRPDRRVVSLRDVSSSPSPLQREVKGVRRWARSPRSFCWYLRFISVIRRALRVSEKAPRPTEPRWCARAESSDSIGTMPVPVPMATMLSYARRSATALPKGPMMLTGRPLTPTSRSFPVHPSSSMTLQRHGSGRLKRE